MARRHDQHDIEQKNLLLKRSRFPHLLSNQDSNLDRQNQNLQCYHYTIGQLPCAESGCKNRTFFLKTRTEQDIVRGQQSPLLLTT